jgi:hypothetical protein
MLDGAISISSEVLTIGQSLVGGVTAQAGQVGVKLGLRGSTTIAWGGAVGGTHPTAASFFAGCANLNYLHDNLYQLRGQFYLGGNAGATIIVDVTRFFR